MFAKRYLERQLRRNSADAVGLPTDLADLRQLADVRQLLVLTPELLLTPYALRKIYPTAGQSQAHRDEAASRASALASVDPDPQLRPLRAAPAIEASGFRLVRSAEYAGSVGRAIGAIIQQIADAGGQAVFLLRGEELSAVFDLVRTPRSGVLTTCLQLEGLKMRLLMLDDLPASGLSNVETVSSLTDELRAASGLLREDGGLMLSLPDGKAPLRLENFSDLPLLLERSRHLVRPLFWLPSKSA